MICQGAFLHFVAVLKEIEKQRGANPSWLPNSTDLGACQGCRRQGETGSLIGSQISATSR
nr:MAG TPA: hypothetical protein [Caudoviricetes sp.]